MDWQAIVILLHKLHFASLKNSTTDRQINVQIREKRNYSKTSSQKELLSNYANGKSLIYSPTAPTWLENHISQNYQHKKLHNSTMALSHTLYDRYYCPVTWSLHSGTSLPHHPCWLQCSELVMKILQHDMSMAGPVSRHTFKTQVPMFIGIKSWSARPESTGDKIYFNLRQPCSSHRLNRVNKHG